MDLLNQINTPISTTIVAACLAALFGYVKYIRRDRLALSYTKTESDCFPLENNDGKYFAINIVNNGGKVLKNIIAELTVSDSEFKSITPHDLISKVEKLANKVKVFIPSLNPKEDLTFIVTSIVKADSTANLKLRAEGVNGEERKTSLSVWDISTVASIAAAAGFFGAIWYINIMSESGVSADNRTSEIYSKFKGAGLSNSFYNLVRGHDEITFEYTAYFLLGEYARDSSNYEKYETLINSLCAIDGVANDSRSTLYYALYTIQTNQGNTAKALLSRQKCLESSSETYNVLIGSDIPTYIDAAHK